MSSNLTNGSNSSQIATNQGIANSVPYFWCIFYGALAVAIIVANVLILIAFARKRKLRTKTNFFIAGLVVSDFLVGAICLPSYMFIIAYQPYGKHVQSSVHDNVYRVWMTLDLFGAAASVLHLTMISLERYYALKWPFRHRVSSRRNYYVILALVWCLSCGFAATAVPAAFATWKHYPLAMTLSVYCFPFCLIVVSYVGILRIASRSHYQNKRMQQAIRSENKIAVSILIIIGFFWLSWTPFVVMNLVYWICHSCALVSPSVIFAFKALQYSNSLANPIIYTLRLPDFKQAIREILFKSSRVRSKIDLKPPSGFSSGINWGLSRSRNFAQDSSQLWLSLSTLKCDGAQLSFYRKTEN